MTSQIKYLYAWAEGFDAGYIAFVVILATIIMYAYLEHLGKRWLAIPLGAILAAIIAFALVRPLSSRLNRAYRI